MTGATDSPRDERPGEASTSPTARDQILAAATELFHERSPSAVSLREIARRADVNYGLIHHYFGTKEGVLAEVFRGTARRGEEVLAGVEAPGAALRLLARDPHSYARMLAWAVLDSDSSKVFGESFAIARIRDLVDRAWEGEAVDEPDGRTEFDPRVVASTAVLVILGWSLFEPYLMPTAGLTDRSADDVRDEVLDLLTRMIIAARPETQDD